MYAPHRFVDMLKACLLIAICFASVGSLVQAAPAEEAKKSTAELEALRDQIRKIKNDIDETRGESANLKKQLEQSEAEVEKALQESRKLDEQIRKKKEALEGLEEQQEKHDTSLQKHRHFLEQQVLTSYQQYRTQHTSSLSLNNESQLIARRLVYQQYVNQARADKMQRVSHDLAELRNIKQALRLEADQLRLLKSQQDAQAQQLQTIRDKRTKLITQLDQKLASKSSSLQSMQADADRLSRLITSLKKAAKKLALKKVEPGQGFTQLKGKLRWPAAGAIMHSYGSPRAGSSLNWQGVLINAPLGSEVRAISDGRVIFSDWFQNLGQLIILDHGQDYMSLYGHNEELFRRVGDKVKMGDVIASVGDTGGRRNSGLYFEVRRKSTPVNPALWCKGKF